MPTSLFPPLSEQQEYWDQRWQATSTANAWSRRRGDAILELLRALRLPTPRILDLGCGTGWFTERLSSLGPATGIDLSEAAISQARSRYPRRQFLAGNLFEMSLPQAYFDVVVSQEVIAHVTDQTGYLQRVARTLKAGGYLVLTTANKFVMDRLGPNEFPPQGAAHVEQYLTMRQLERLISPRFRVLRKRVILPMGQRGILRVVNSYKLNRLLQLALSPASVAALKERAGVGYTLIVLGRKLDRV